MLIKLLLFYFIWYLGILIGYIVPTLKFKPFGMFDFYPFICRKCMTTWTLLVLYGTASYILDSPSFFIVGAIASAATGAGLYYTERERTEKNNDKK